MCVRLYFIQMKFYFKTYGCKLNEVDSELLRGLLLRNFKEVKDFKGADFVVINTCGVVDRTEKKIIEKTKYFQNKGKKVFWTGCLPLITKNNISNGSIGPNNILDIEKVIKENIHVYNKERIDKAFLYEYKKEKVSLNVAISEGCLGDCSYCGSKIARGKLNSFSKEKILEEIKRTRAKEILLTSQGLASYGLDKGTQELPSLISDILKIKKDFKLRLGMMNPRFTINIIDDLIELYKNEKVYKFLHLPLQSGDNDLLYQMNRGYTADDFLNIVKKFKKVSSDTILATDIIVGHPKESKEAFQKTVKIIEEVKPEILHVFRYSKREGTKDFELKELSTKIKKQRSKYLVDLFQNYNLKKNKEFLNKEFEVLVIQKYGLARTDSGRAVVVKNVRVGERRKVKIVDFKWNYLIGEALKSQ